jgi:hypothetical protein|tara:strand:- start:1077 stop:1823 length:747 start_codon:yes stop_codon:yes gene_type:complete
MEDLNNIKKEGYYLSTPEFALMLGCSTEALRSRRRRGELEGQFKYDGQKYWWKSLRPITVKKIRNDRLKVSSSLSRASRKRRRGVHISGQETKYPNQAFKQANEIRLLATLKNNLPKSVINEITPEAVKVAQDNLLKKRLKQQEDKWRPRRNYGGLINGSQLQQIYRNQDQINNYWESRNEDRQSDDNSFFLNNSYRSGRGYAYQIGEPNDPGSVELEPRELVDGDANYEHRFKNKIEEEIYRLKKNK